MLEAHGILNGDMTQPPPLMLGGPDDVDGVSNSGSGRSTPSSGSDPAPNKLFVGGLSWQTTSEKLREYFGQYGTVSDVLIMKDPVTQVINTPDLLP